MRACVVGAMQRSLCYSPFAGWMLVSVGVALANVSMRRCLRVLCYAEALLFCHREARTYHKFVDPGWISHMH
jgi:hypothetical protein